jgi:hypothetical protein
MNPTNVRRSFIAFHLVLGLGLLAGSLETLIHSATTHSAVSHVHVAIVAALEAAAALLFLIPRTMRAGALLLVFTIGLAFLLHALQGEWRPDLAIYATGVWFVYAHGSAWGQRDSGAPA